MHNSHSTPAVSRDLGRGNVLFVHGVGGPVPGWDTALTDGLTTSGVPAQNLELRTITYADAFEENSSPTADPDLVNLLDLPLRRGPKKAAPGQVLRHQNRLREVAQAAATSPGGTDGAKRFRPPKIVPSEVVARLPLPGMWHADAYRNRTEVRQLVRRRVAASITAAPTGRRIVIAHSLGSVVVLDALHIFNFSIDLLITVGSPLGIDDGRTYEWDPVHDFPTDQIGGWLNVVNTRDPVPWGRGASGRFPQVVDAFITAGSRLSGPGGVHDPAVYTGSAVVVDAVAQGLQT